MHVQTDDGTQDHILTRSGAADDQKFPVPSRAFFSFNERGCEYPTCVHFLYVIRLWKLTTSRKMVLS